MYNKKRKRKDETWVWVATQVEEIPAVTDHSVTEMRSWCHGMDRDTRENNQKRKVETGFVGGDDERTTKKEAPFAGTSFRVGLLTRLLLRLIFEGFVFQ
jgi:hypothetical protein